MVFAIVPDELCDCGTSQCFEEGLFLRVTVVQTAAGVLDRTAEFFATRFLTAAWGFGTAGPPGA